MNVYTVCYDELYVFDSKEKAKNYFGGCYYASEGAEQSRYASILIGLDFNNIANDGVSKGCKQININVDGDDIISCELKNKMETKNAIRYYQEKILPILELADEYGVDFSRKMPFDDFGSDEETDYMQSFSDFYKKILGNDLCIQTVEQSDGKYQMEINDELVIDIKAWDNLKNVIDNVEIINEKLEHSNYLVTRPCYFFNVGVVFDINDFESAYDVWNCNGNACMSDIINGLSCENYGIYFNKNVARDKVVNYVKNGINNTYGYIVEKNITLPKEEWNSIDEYLVENYDFENISDAQKNGFISFDFSELIEENSSYYEQPDESYLKKDNSIIQNCIKVYDKKTALEKNYEAVSKILKDIYQENIEDLEI